MTDPRSAAPAKGGRAPLVFPSRSKPEPTHVPAGAPWRILIADDEPEVHSVTRMLLRDFTFDGRGLEFLSTWSGAETMDMMARESDIAVVLLDVVMEADHAGLEVVRHIRRELANSSIRIVLRTGQPGYAPEKQVVEEFDINDYREKTELTAQKLTTVVMSALRAYRDIRKLEIGRSGLEWIIVASSTLFQHQSAARFARAMLDRLAGLIGRGTGGSGIGEHLVSGFAAVPGPLGLDLMAGIGRYAALRPGRPMTVSPSVAERLAAASEERTCLIGERDFVACFRSATGAEQLVYLEAPQRFDEIDGRLLRVFATNLGVAYDNMCLTRELADTSADIVQTLSDVVETRSVETSRHTLRVGRAAVLLAEKLGLPESALDVLRMAAPMHDLGKVGIPDALLNKPGKLTAEEYTCVKTHTTIGYSLLRGKRRLLDAAAEVCLQHHERWDGAGYPRGLKGTEIDLLGRIVGLVDVFDAVFNDRPYKRAWPPDEVRTYILSERGGQFDPQLVDLFIAHFDEFIALEAEEAPPPRYE